MIVGHDTNPGIPKYRPLFLDHFDKKETETQNQFIKNQDLNKTLSEPSGEKVPEEPATNSTSEEVAPSAPESAAEEPEEVPLNFVPPHPQVVRQSADNIQCVNLFQGPECEFVSSKVFVSSHELWLPMTSSFQLKFLSYEELEQRLSNLDKEMEKELNETRKRYIIKKKPIIDAIETKQHRRQTKMEEF